MTFTPATFACGVDIVGPSNLVTLIESFRLLAAVHGDDLAQTCRRSTHASGSTTPARTITTDARGQNPEALVDWAGRERPAGDAQGIRSNRRSNASADIPVTYVVYADEGGFQLAREPHLVLCRHRQLPRHVPRPHRANRRDLKGAAIDVPAGVEGVPGPKAALPAR